MQSAAGDGMIRSLSVPALRVCALAGACREARTERVVLEAGLRMKTRSSIPADVPNLFRPAGLGYRSTPKSIRRLSNCNMPEVRFGGSRSINAMITSVAIGLL